jgi:hypothetical protein
MHNLEKSLADGRLGDSRKVTVLGSTTFAIKANDRIEKRRKP